jgi:hypothetical protein
MAGNSDASQALAGSKQMVSRTCAQFSISSRNTLLVFIIITRVSSGFIVPKQQVYPGVG